MAINNGYLKSDRTINGDEVYTPFYAVEPILEFLDKDKIYWLPFDEDWSAFNQLLRERGFKVINTNLKNGQNFFEYEPRNYDVIISNPPFSKKDKVLERLMSLGKPFAIIVPVQTIQGKARFKDIEKCQMLSFDARINYHTNNNFETYTKGNHFASIYLCKDLLPSDWVKRKLFEYERPLKE